MPILNELATLPALLINIQDRLEQVGCNWIMMLVNDGSTDGSRELLNDLANQDSRFKVLHLSRNFGHTAAVRAGLEFVDADAVILMDSNGEDDPSAIPSMVLNWHEGADVVYAMRFARKESWLRRKALDLFYRTLQRFSSIDIPRNTGNFGLVDRAVLEHLRRMPENERFFPGMRSWVGFKQVAVPVEHLARHPAKLRSSFYGLISLVKSALFGFSRVPLMAFYWLALLSGIVTAGCIGMVLIHAVMQWSIPSWAAMTSVCAFFGAINSLGLAILGEYIARIYDQVRGRPPYIIARSRNLSVSEHRDSVESIADAILADIHDLRSEIEVIRQVQSTDMETNLWMSIPEH